MTTEANETSSAQPELPAQPEVPAQSEVPTVAGLLAQARLELAAEQYVSRGVATDWLLDLLNAAVRPPVRRVVLSTLEDFCHRNLAPSTEFFEALDQVQIALQVDAAYDEFELEAA